VNASQLVVDSESEAGAGAEDGAGAVNMRGHDGNCTAHLRAHMSTMQQQQI